LTTRDNAVIESWHSTLEFELRRLEHFATKAAARAGVAAWIEDYNTARRHSSCAMMPPWPGSWPAAPGWRPREPGRPLRGPDREGDGFAAAHL
jgi:transposase InsO family protein